MIKPIRNQILIKLFDGDNTSDGGIIVPDSFKLESNKGKVIAVGSGTKDKKMQFKKGDIIFRVQGHGTVVDHNGERYYIMDQNTILATG